MTDIFRTVLNMSITGSYIAVVIIILRLFMKKLPKKYSYFLWAILGIRLLCPFSFSSALSIFNVLIPEKPEISSGQMEYIPRDIEYSYEPQVTVSVPQVNDTVNTYLPAAEPNNSVNPMQIVLGVCAWVWLIGVMAMLIYTVCSYIKVKKIVADSRSIGDNIFICRNIESPFVYGIIRPRIYVPEGISENDMRYIAAHENTHIKRCDHIIKLIAVPALSIHWFNPLVWVSYRLMVKDMELSCDEKAVQSFDGDVRKDYANALLNMSVRQNKLYGMLAFGESNIKSRIKRVLSLKKPRVIAAVGAVILLVIAAVCLLTNAQSRPDIDDGRYISGRNIAISALNSTFGYYSGYFYDFEGDTLTITPREGMGGSEYKLSAWTDLPYTAEEWDNMTEMLLDFDMSGYDEVRYMELGSSYLLMKVDNELWIAKIRGEEIWSIYSLVLYDRYVNDNYNSALNSFEITKTEDGYTASSPQTDIYFFFTEDEYEYLHVRRNIGETTEETVIPYLGGFDPYRTGLYLLDITGDGTDDVFVNTYFTGTGIVYDATAVIDGSTMKEIPINRLEAERLISENSAKLLTNDDFTDSDPHLSAVIPDMDESYIYPYYPDKSVRRYGGMMYELMDGQVTGRSVFGFVRNESEHSKLYRAYFVFEYHDGELLPVSISVGTAESDNKIPVHNSYAAVNKDGYVYNIPIEEGYEYISPYIWGDAAEAPIAAEYSANELRLYPTEKADGQYVIMRLLHDGGDYYYEFEDTNFRSWFSIDEEIWHTLEMNIDMYSLREMHAVVGERLSNGKYILSDGNADYTIYSDRELAVGDRVTVMYLGNVLAVDNALLDAVEVVPENSVSTANIPDLTICKSYLTDYWNDFFKTGTFSPENYISDSDMLSLANSRKLYNGDTEGHGVEHAEAVIDESSVQYGSTSEGRLWVYFVYDVMLSLDDGSESTEHFTGYTAYFELDGKDGGYEIYREYQLWGAELTALGLGDEISLPIENADIKGAAEKNILLAEENSDNTVMYNYVYISDVYHSDGMYGYSLDPEDASQVQISLYLPYDWEFGGNTADCSGEKVFEIGVPYPEGEGINYDDFKTDYALGREITVHEEIFGGEDDMFDYYIFNSTPDFYSDDGSYDSYVYVVSRNGYSITLSFISDAGTDERVIRRVIDSLDISDYKAPAEAG